VGLGKKKKRVEVSSNSDLSSEEEWQKSKGKKVSPAKKLRTRVESTSCSDLEDLEEQNSKEKDVRISSSKEMEEGPCSSWNSGGLVVADYEQEWFIAEIVKNQERIPSAYYRLSYAAHRGENTFIWPDRKDMMLTLKEDILMKNVTVVPINNRGFFKLSDSDHKKIKAIMMVVVCLFFFPKFPVPVPVLVQGILGKIEKRADNNHFLKRRNTPKYRSKQNHRSYQYLYHHDGCCLLVFQFFPKFPVPVPVLVQGILGKIEKQADNNHFLKRRNTPKSRPKQNCFLCIFFG